MGWNVGKNMLVSESVLHFPTLEEAKQYCDDNRLDYEIIYSNRSKMKIKKYNDNFL